MLSKLLILRVSESQESPKKIAPVYAVCTLLERYSSARERHPEALVKTRGSNADYLRS
jgi:hypothetical protein